MQTLNTILGSRRGQAQTVQVYLEWGDRDWGEIKKSHKYNQH